MTSKFNKDMYAKIKGKKNEPLSSIGQKTLRFTDREKEKEKEKEKETTERGSSTPTLDEAGAASPAISLEEVPAPKRQKTGKKGKEKVGFSAWEDADTAFARANEFFTPEEKKEISLVPSHQMVNQHVHKLVQVSFELSSSFSKFFFFLTQVFILRCWGRPCTLPHNFWRVKRKPSWLPQRWRLWRLRLQF